ncbi:hypothetical protein Nepgr_025915 [Nepenthes gracilis]|uniref:MOSC domain-containing protein n=1 Tax=Nepenthes gracilis TaxID=150966 RepID=A0AAD3XZX8_NEPGR|nr:hypothetical protein Nepgr_025915 [Nepenthes gracilis]
MAVCFSKKQINHNGLIRLNCNILVDGCEPFSEDMWKEIQINKLTFYGVRLRTRYKVPLISQETGIVGSEPTQALKTLRSDKVSFGQSMVCKNSMTGRTGKVVRVNDPVFVIQRVPSAAGAAT